MDRGNWRHLVLVRNIKASQNCDEALDALKLLLDFVDNKMLEDFFEDYIKEDNDSEEDE